MDSMRRKITLGIVSAPVVGSLSACSTSDDETETYLYDLDEVTQQELTNQLGGDEATAKQILPWINNFCFDMALTPTDISNISVLIAYGFGNRPNDSGDPNELAKPGPMNKALADCCAEIYRKKPMELYVQWEIARHLETDEYADIPSSDIISIEPYWDSEGNLVYLSTEGVAQAVVDDHFGGNASSMGVVGVIGHRDHAKRCLQTSQAVGMTAFHFDGLELPTWYDELSDQPWTRDRPTYVFQDITSQFYNQAQININS